MMFRLRAPSNTPTHDSSTGDVKTRKWRKYGFIQRSLGEGGQRVCIRVFYRVFGLVVDNKGIILSNSCS